MKDLTFNSDLMKASKYVCCLLYYRCEIQLSFTNYDYSFSSMNLTSFICFLFFDATLIPCFVY